MCVCGGAVDREGERSRQSGRENVGHWVGQKVKTGSSCLMVMAKWKPFLSFDHREEKRDSKKVKAMLEVVYQPWVDVLVM